MRDAVLAALLLVLVVALVPSARAAECPYFPLSHGWRWEYVGDGGDGAVAWVEGTQVVQGKETLVLHWQYSGAVNEYLEQYFTIGADGDALIHGFWNHSVGLVRSFSPPVTYLPCQLEPTLMWCTAVQSYSDLEGTVPVDDPFEICFRVYAVQQVQVPAGEFTSFGVGQFVEPPARPHFQSRDELGRPVFGGRGAAEDWYTANVGVIAFQIYQRFELSAWTNPGVPNGECTWGAIKTRFWSNRNGQ